MKTKGQTRSEQDISSDINFPPIQSITKCHWTEDMSIGTRWTVVSYVKTVKGYFRTLEDRYSLRWKSTLETVTCGPRGYSAVLITRSPRFVLSFDTLSIELNQDFPQIFSFSFSSTLSIQLPKFSLSLTPLLCLLPITCTFYLSFSPVYLVYGRLPYLLVLY